MELGKESEEFVTVIGHVISDISNPIQIDKLARFCIHLAEIYLKYMESRGKRIRETNDPKEIEGIAADCIADLFTVRDHSYIYFKRYFTPLYQKDPDAADVFIHLRKLVSSKVYQYLTRVYRQRDPEGAKLLRNIRLAVKKHSKLELKRDFTGEYIYYPLNQRVYRPHVSELELVISNVATAKSDIFKLLSQMFEFLISTFHCSLEIETYALMHCFRNFRQSSSVEYSEPDPLFSVSIEELCRIVNTQLEKMQAKINTTYVNKGKLTQAQGYALYQGLYDFSFDILQSGGAADYYEYIVRYWPELSKDHYMQSIRKIFEYLVRQIKDVIKLKIKEISDYSPMQLNNNR